MRPLNDQFCEPFGGAHYIGGPHRLVGRDQYEPFDAAIAGGISHNFRAKDVVTGARNFIGFNQRHMFVSRRVENDRNVILLDRFPDAVGIEN